MAARKAIFPTGTLLGLLIGMVLVPGALSIVVGVLAIALWGGSASGIVLGVLTLSFAAMAVAGGITSLVFLTKSEGLAQMQSDFVAAVSHELRTPLAGIRILAETIAMGRADEPARRREVVDLMLAEVTRLQDLVDRILRWRSLEAGAGVAAKVPLQVEAVLERAVEPLRATAAQVGGPDVVLKVADDLPPVMGDGEALVDCFRNLVHNAVKFGGDRGPIEVSATSEGREVVVAVRDSGLGIPRSEQKRIFERFYRVDVLARDRQGVGLGLAIVKSVVSSHGGRIVVQSEEGEGSTFVVRLPAARERAPGGGSKPAPAETTTGERKADETRA